MSAAKPAAKGVEKLVPVAGSPTPPGLSIDGSPQMIWNPGATISGLVALVLGLTKPNVGLPPAGSDMPTDITLYAVPGGDANPAELLVELNIAMRELRIQLSHVLSHVA
jgi:hypothetical protein